MKDNDRKLLQAFERRRDESSFRRLYGRHTPMLFALAVRLCGSRSQAEEITQEAWVRAVERHDRFHWQSRYSTWLSGILINCYRESARRQAKAPVSLDDSRHRAGGPGIARVVAPTVESAMQVDLERALTRLADGYREVVILHDINGHTHKEIAAMLGIGEGTSKSQLTRGRARLRELLTNPTQSRDARDERGIS